MAKNYQIFYSSFLSGGMVKAKNIHYRHKIFCLSCIQNHLSKR